LQYHAPLRSWVIQAFRLSCVETHLCLVAWRSDQPTARRIPDRLERVRPALNRSAAPIFLRVEDPLAQTGAKTSRIFRIRQSLSLWGPLFEGGLKARNVLRLKLTGLPRQAFSQYRVAGCSGKTQLARMPPGKNNCNAQNADAS